MGLKAFVDEHPQGLRQPLANGARHLSLGIRRRLALVRALTTRARLAILDEPSEGLDQEGQQQMAQVLNQLAGQGCTLLIFATHPATFQVDCDLLDLNSKPVPRLTRLTQGPSG